MEAAMDNLETIQKSHQKEIVQIQDACNQQGIVILAVTKHLSGCCGSQKGGVFAAETSTGE